MMEYFNHKLSRKHHPPPEVRSETPVLTEEDEEFLQRIASEGTPPPLPERPHQLPVAGESHGNNAQLALMHDARNTPLPDIPDTPDEDETPVKEGKGKEKAKSEKRPMTWSFLRRDSRDRKRNAQHTTAVDLHSVAEGIKTEDAHVNEDGVVTPHEAAKEEEDMTNILEQLNLAAVNNRVFSISKESQELLHKFTFVLKDLVNGVPTAYDDLESLLTNSENQLQNAYAHLPSFLQKLIEQLPSKMTQTLGPEMLAAAAERHGVSAKYAEPAAGLASKMGWKMKVPSLKDLVTKPGAVAGMLRAIMNFLKMRFPAFMGMNVLWSLALFLLLFVFWYCHKRGKEVRLEKERFLNEEEIAALERDIASDPNMQPPTTTTAPEGASMEEVTSGMRHGTAPELEEMKKTASEPSASAASHSQPAHDT